MNVLSLFDGMSCGRIALERAGMPVTNYFASEIDKNAITISKHNYPDIDQLGDVVNINYYDGILSTDTKSRNVGHIDLLMGGSPCQGFSFAGKRLNFEDPRSKLFFEFVRLKEKIKPKYFFLENVRMDKKCEDIISEYMGVEPIKFNSLKISAQSRYRLYWTNIQNIKMPIHSDIVAKDILLDISNRQTFPYENELQFDDWRTNRCLKVGMAPLPTIDQGKRVYSMNAKLPTLDTKQGGNRETKVAISSTHYIKLNRCELEALQGVPKFYTNSVCNSHANKAIGNGWQVDTITHIFKNIPL